MKSSEKVAVSSLLAVATAAILVAYYKTNYDKPTKDSELPLVIPVSVSCTIQFLLDRSWRSIKPASHAKFCLATTLIVVSLMTAEYLNKRFSLLFTGAILALGNSLIYCPGAYCLSRGFIERDNNNPSDREKSYRKLCCFFMMLFLFLIIIHSYFLFLF